MKSWSHIFLISIFIGGVIFSLLLQLPIQKNVFFNGDAGLKALLTRQLSEGYYRFNIEIQAEDWEKQLWERGYYPFDEPFMYEKAGKKFIAFPVFFSILSTPFFMAIGFWGLHVIPLLAIWILWVHFFLLLRKLEFKNYVKYFGGIALIFSCPLTIYCAMFWEHTLAVLLAFQGLSVLIFPISNRKYAIIGLFLRGMLMGVAGWLRPECYIYAILVSVFFLFQKGKFWSKLGLISGLALELLTHLTFNYLNYDNFLGVHSIQVVKHFDLISQLKGWTDVLLKLSTLSFQFSPLLLIIVLLFVLSVFRKADFSVSACKIFILCLLYVIITPFILPNFGGYQWGPRYFLVIFPTSLLFLLFTMDRMENYKILWKVVIGFGISFCLIAGVYQNTYLGTQYIEDHYMASAISYQAIANSRQSVIVASNPWIGMKLTPIFGDKKFFCSRTPKETAVLSLNIYAIGIKEFLYLKSDFESAPPDLDLEYKGKNIKVNFSESGSFGGTVLYDAVIKL